MRPSLSRLLAAALACGVVAPACAQDRPAAAPPSPPGGGGAMAVEWRWEPPPRAGVGMPATDGDDVAFTYGHRYLALYGADGTPRWELERAGLRDVAPRLTPDLVVAATDDGVVAVDRATGQERWHTVLGERANSPVSAGGRAVVSTWEGSLVALDPAGGRVAWRATLPGPAVGPAAAPTGAGGEMVVTTWESEHGDAAGAVAVDAATGRRRWAVPLEPGGVSAPGVTAGGTVVVVAGDVAAHGLRLSTGERRWRTETGGAGSPEAPPLDRGDGTVLVASRLGEMALVDEGDGAGAVAGVGRRRRGAGRPGRPGAPGSLRPAPRRRPPAGGRARPRPGGPRPAGAGQWGRRRRGRPAAGGHPGGGGERPGRAPRLVTGGDTVDACGPPSQTIPAPAVPRSPSRRARRGPTTNRREKGMPVAVVTMKQLLEAGVHFGHQTRRWNPKMRRFIFGERNGIYIIDLNQTLERISTAYTFVRNLSVEGGVVLFVGTKKQTQDPIADAARKCGMPYINERWLGGMLTNFSTISARVKKMQEYERMKEAGDFEAMPKKEALILSRELEKLQRNLGGIRNLARLPDAVFIIDTKKEHIAVTEANKLGLPIVAVVDTNCDPDVIQYVIPGNDDAIRAGTLMCRVIADAVEEGRLISGRRNAKAAAAKAAESGQAAPDPEAEARRTQAQAEARRQAALQAQEREARARRPIPPPPETPPVPAAAAPPVEPAGPPEAAPEVAGPGPVPADAPDPVAAAPQTAAVEAAGTPKADPAGELMAEFTAKDVQALRQSTGAGMMDAKRALQENDGDPVEAARWLREKGLSKSVERAGRANDQGAVAVATDGSSAAVVELRSETDYVAKSAEFKALADELARAVAADGEDAAAKRQDQIDSLRITLKENIDLGRVVRFEAPEGAVLDAYLHVQNERGVNGVLVEVVGGDATLAHDIALHVAAMRPEWLSRDEVPAERVEEERKVLETLTRNEGKPTQAVPKIVDGRINGWFRDHCLLEQQFVKDPKQTISGLLGEARLTRFAQVEIGR